MPSIHPSSITSIANPTPFFLSFFLSFLSFFLTDLHFIPGTLSSLKNVKKDVTEMRKGNDCGMGFENWTAFQVGDQVQTYEETSEKRTL